jgi:Aspartyl protease
VAILNGRPLRPPHEQNPRANLQVHGPLIVVQLSKPDVQAPAAVVAAGEEPPAQPVILTGYALVDTGASHTSVDENAAQQLGLVATGSIPMQTPGGLRQASQYAVGYRIAGNFVTIPAMSAELNPQGLIMLIGRDILASCVLTYNGTDGTFSLSW